MKTLLCCIVKSENRYINEYVDYYKNLGVTNIVIYDNNDPNGEYPEEYLRKEIAEGFVIIENFRGIHLCQLPAYNDCYLKYGNQYDWIMFFDCDEYLTLVNHDNIESFLSQNKFNNYSAIHINWMIYGDNDLLYYENKPLIERFTTPAPYDVKDGNIMMNYHIKSIVKGGLSMPENNILFVNPHTPGMMNDELIAEDPYSNYKIICCDALGNTCINSPFLPYNFSEAYIKHFVTKTADEYANRIKRGNPDVEMTGQFIDSLVKRFFNVNKPTKEKIEIIKSKFTQ